MNSKDSANAALGVFCIPSQIIKINWWKVKAQIWIQVQTYELPEDSSTIKAFGRTLNFGYKKVKAAYKFGLMKIIFNDNNKVPWEYSQSEENDQRVKPYAISFQP